jgi:hypothetical protein
VTGTREAKVRVTYQAGGEKLASQDSRWNGNDGEGLVFSTQWKVWAGSEVKPPMKRQALT